MIDSVGKSGLIHKSQNAPVPYLTMLHSEQNVLNGALWDMEQMRSVICEIGLLFCCYLLHDYLIGVERGFYILLRIICNAYHIDRSVLIHYGYHYSLLGCLWPFILSQGLRFSKIMYFWFWNFWDRMFLPLDFF